MDSFIACFKSLIGISFITILLDMVLLNGSFRKYARSVLGLFTVLVMLQGFLQIKDVRLDLSVIDDIKAAAEDNQVIAQDKLLDAVVTRVTERIKTRLYENEIIVNSLIIDFSENYEIKKVELSVNDYSKNKDKTIQLLVDEFSIDENVITVR